MKLSTLSSLHPCERRIMSEMPAYLSLLQKVEMVNEALLSSLRALE